MIFFRQIFWKKAHKKLLAKFVSAMVSQDNFDVSNTILIMGSARSGTTFVMESINHKNEYRVIFEPFVSEYSEEWRGYSSRQYWNPENINPKQRKDIDDILSGKVNNDWVNGHNMKTKSSKRIVKAIRANLLLPAIRHIYPSLPILYITRDIKEVVQSRLKLGFDDELNAMLTQDEFLNKYYPSIDIKSIYATTQTKAGKHALLWLLENKYILSLDSSFGVHHITYNNIKGKSIRYEEGNFKVVEEVSAPSASTSNADPYHLSDKEIIDIEKVIQQFS